MTNVLRKIIDVLSLDINVGVINEEYDYISFVSKMYNVLVFKYQVLRNVLGYKYIFEAQVQSTSKYSKKCTSVQVSTSTDVLDPNPGATSIYRILKQAKYMKTQNY